MVMYWFSIPGAALKPLALSGQTNYYFQLGQFAKISQWTGCTGWIDKSPYIYAYITINHN